MNKTYYKIYRIGLAFRYGFLWRKPMFLIKATKNTLLHRLNLKKGFTLRTLCLAITYTCNYDCQYCFTTEMLNKRKKENYLQLEDYQRIAKEARDMGAISFAFQGGEIWLRKDYKEVINAFQPKKHYITVTTNGFFVNEKTIQELVDLRVDMILFSLESGMKQEHDKITNRVGSYDVIMKAIQTAIKNKRIKVGINLVLSKNNIYSNGVNKLIEFTKNNNIILNIIFARALGHWKEYRKVMLSQKDIDYFEKNIKSIHPYFSRDINFNYGGGGGCPAAKENFYINPWGDVLACPFNHTFFGNLKKTSLQDIQNRAMKIKWFNHFHPKCLTAEEKTFMDLYFRGIDESKNGFVDYKYWLKKQSSKK